MFQVSILCHDGKSINTYCTHWEVIGGFFIITIPEDRMAVNSPMKRVLLPAHRVTEIHIRETEQEK